MLSKAKRNYDITKKELLAVIYSLKTFKQYVLVRHFVVCTDHAALQRLRKTPEPMGQQARWLTFIEMFDFEIRHRPSSRHGNADGLSRRPSSVDGDDDTKARGVSGQICQTDFESDDNGNAEVNRSTLSVNAPPNGGALTDKVDLVYHKLQFP